MSKKYIFFSLVILIGIGVAGRLFPHAANITPVTAVALIVSAYLGVRYSIPVVLGLMFISDMFIRFYSLPIMLSVYGSFILAGLLGGLLQRFKTIGALFTLTVGSSLLFFLVTNWAVWQFGTMYSYTLSGLLQSYWMAIPFFKNSLMGDVLYTGLFFGMVHFAHIILAKRHIQILAYR